MCLSLEKIIINFFALVCKSISFQERVPIQMKRLGPDGDDDGVPEQCACMRMNEQDDGAEEEFSTQYCWQTLHEGQDECVPVENFPLRRRSCGFFRLGASHVNHEADRVKVNVVAAIRLIAALEGSWNEVSDQDCDFSPFVHIVDPPLPNRELETVRKYLVKALMCDPNTSTVGRIPIDEEHADKMLIIYPTILDEHLERVHASFSKMFRDLGLTDGFFFRGAGGSGTEALNTYPVVFAGFTEDDGDLVGVYAIRVDT